MRTVRAANSRTGCTHREQISQARRAAQDRSLDREKLAAGGARVVRDGIRRHRRWEVLDARLAVLSENAPAIGVCEAVGAGPCETDSAGPVLHASVRQQLQVQGAGERLTCGGSTRTDSVEKRYPHVARPTKGRWKCRSRGPAPHPCQRRSSIPCRHCSTTESPQTHRACSTLLCMLKRR